MERFRKTISFLLALVLTVGMLPPARVQAAEGESLPEESVVTEETTISTETLEPETVTEASVETTVPEETEVPTVAEMTEEPTIPEETEEPTVSETEEPEFIEFEELENQEDLLMGFLNRLISDDGSGFMGETARETLSAAEQYVYDQVKPIVRQIAIGQRESTEIEVDLEGPGYSPEDVSPWKVYHALIHDCPYDLYWARGGTVYSYNTLVGFVFVPAKEFQGDSEYTIKTELGTRAVAAAETAKAIVKKNENLDDYDKLTAYADTICSLVEYDYNAAFTSPEEAGLDPWRLINVFDGDPDTNVVCMGYAHAFQYLCDLSQFEADIKCYSPCNEEHMWNIVRIDGISYLMDVTHCDGGDTAYRWYKFLDGVPGSVEEGFQISTYLYDYCDTCRALFGTGEDSILQLAPTHYPGDMTQAEFIQELKNCGGSYVLYKEPRITSDMTIRDVELKLDGRGWINIAPGVTLTLEGTTSVYVGRASSFHVEEGATLLICNNEEFRGFTPGWSGEGNYVRANYDDGFLSVSGVGTVKNGILDKWKDTTQTVFLTNLSIADDLFNGFEKLKDLVLYDVPRIGARAFDGCKDIEYLSIPDTVTSIGEYAFRGCTGLERIIFQGDPPVQEGNGGIFEGVVTTGYYPLGNPKWTEEVRASFGSGITWIGECTNGHDVVTVPGKEPTCGEPGLAEGSYCGVCGEILQEQYVLAPTGKHTYTDGEGGTCKICGKEWQEEVLPFNENEWELLERINKLRCQVGVEPLTSYARLQEATDAAIERRYDEDFAQKPIASVLNEYGIAHGYSYALRVEEAETLEDAMRYWTEEIEYFRQQLQDYSFDIVGVGQKDDYWIAMLISASTDYTSMELMGSGNAARDPGESIEDMNLVLEVFDTFRGSCYLPVLSEYCQDFDPDSTGDQTVTISVLGFTTTVNIHTHSWTEATCTRGRSCTGCGVQEDPLGHVPLPVEGKEPTCEDSGLTAGSDCERCGVTLEEQEFIPALGHDVFVEVGWEATCTLSGLSDGEYCLRCHEVLSPQEVLEATDHWFIEGACVDCGAEDKPDYTLFAGKSVTLKAVHPKTGQTLTSKQVTWSVHDDHKGFASITSAGKLTARKIYEWDRIRVLATVKATGESISYFVEVFPQVSQAEILRGSENVTGKTVKMDFEDEPLTFRVAAYPKDTAPTVKWTVKDTGEKYAEYDIDGDTLTVSNPKDKAGTVTVTATVDAGVKKTVTMKIQFASYAKTVEISEPAKTTLRGGESLTLKAAITDPDAVSKPGITWSVSDKKAASVSSTGKVTAKSVPHPTVVTITATSKDGRAMDSVDLKILPKNEGQLVLMSGETFVTGKTHTLEKDETLQLNAAVMTNGLPEERVVTWSSGKTAVATVQDGLVTAVGAGTAKITATLAKGKTVSMTVKVTTVAKDMEISTKGGKNLIREKGETLAQVSSGKSITLAAKILTEGAAKAVTWSVDDGEDYAKITSSGKVTAAKNLSDVHYVTVRATAKDGGAYSETFRVKVLPLATGVKIRYGGTILSDTVYDLDLLSRPELKLNAVVYPRKANQEVTFTSSNTKIASIDQKGKLTCHKTGTVTITATAKDGSGKKTSFKVNVVKMIQDLSMKDDAPIRVAGGSKLKLASKILISPDKVTSKKLSWQVSANSYGITIASDGTMTTRKVSEPVTVRVTVRTLDGSGLTLRFPVTVYPK